MRNWNDKAWLDETVINRSQLMQSELSLRQRMHRWWSGALAVCALMMAALLSACASGPELVNHAFGFDAVTDSPNYEVIAYKYGQGSFHTTSSNSAIRQFGQSPQATGINGPMPLGDSLYVKWRNKQTEQVFEKTVDLKPLLPKDMTHQRIHFVVAEGDVFVYLVDLVPRSKDWSIV